MKTLDDSLIAILLGDARPAADLRRWLETAEGQRELTAYRRVIGLLHRLYGEPAVSPPLRTIYTSALPTPIGRVLVAASDRGLVRVSFRRSEGSFAAELEQRLRARIIPSPAKTSHIVRQLRDYFAGRRRRFSIGIDFSHVTPFQRKVLRAAARVPAGQVVSYGEIARRIGRPGGSRAVGQALGRNPVPIVIPCHRIVAAGGRLGGYTGGLDIKRKLLDIEGALEGVG